MGKMRPLRYTARKIATLESRPGAWSKQKIGVFDGETQIGEYEYTYSSGVPFYAFEQDNKWYALISGANYTKTDLITLPDCKVIGGEELVPHGCGFCPVEFYVPAYTVHKSRYRDGSEMTFRMYDDNDYDDSAENGTPWIYERFGFRSGCVWGDDTSWKLQLLDLTLVAQGIVTKIDIGYVELAPYPLRECIELHDDNEDGVYAARVSTLSYLKLSDPLKQLGIAVAMKEEDA
jgi:hypothetical protein